MLLRNKRSRKPLHLPPPPPSTSPLRCRNSKRRTSRSTQSWIRALGNFQVLGSPVVLGGLQHQEQRPLWSRRVRDISMVPALFKAITRVKTDRGLMWERILTVRQVLTQEGKITVAVGHGSSYEELDGPTKMHGLVGALFARMWDHADFKCYYTLRHLSRSDNWKIYDMITTLMATYNHFCKEAGLPSRMLRRRFPDLGVRIVHDAEANVDPRTGLSERHKRAIEWVAKGSKRSRDSQPSRQPWNEAWTEQEGDEEEDYDYTSSSWNRWSARDDQEDEDWGDWSDWHDSRQSWHRGSSSEQPSSSSWYRSSWSRS